MDGYHFSRAQLSRMPDPAVAHARRGAEFTFDGASYLQLIRRVRAQEPLPGPPLPPAVTLRAPSFDHALKDPVEDDIAILGSSRILLFEGLYLSLDREPWSTAARLMDRLWFVDVDRRLARARLVERHVLTGVAATKEEAERRADESDLVNGDQIVSGRMDVHIVVRSVEEEGYGSG